MGVRRLGVGVGALLLVAALAATGCAPARSPYVLDYPIPKHLPVQTERYRLGNGLEVILSEDHAVPFVAVDLWCHVGSKDDPPHRAGLAHLCEHLMFEGSRHVAPYEHFTRLADVGAEDVNAWTNVDSTSFHETVPSSRIETALWLESDRMASGAEMLDQTKLDSERKIVENELRETYEGRALRDGRALRPGGALSRFASVSSPRPRRSPAARCRDPRGHARVFSGRIRTK